MKAVKRLALIIVMLSIAPIQAQPAAGLDLVDQVKRVTHKLFFKNPAR